MKRKINVTITREACVEIEIDDTVIDGQQLLMIEQGFADLEDIDDWDNNFEIDNCDDIRLYNYAKIAALHKLGVESEFINIDGDHTKAKVHYSCIEVDFEDFSE